MKKISIIALILIIYAPILYAAGEREVNWRSSTTRADTGNGACELFYVEKVRLKNKIYR